MTDRVFVYGTLKYKDVLERVIKRQFDDTIIPAYLIDFFSLYDLGNFPGLVKDTQRHIIYGNLIKVNQEDLNYLDDYESLDSGLYTRETVFVHDNINNLIVDAFVYVLGSGMMSGTNKMTVGCWERDHG